METVHRIRLRPGKESKLLAGHLWIYQNEVDNLPPRVAPGDLADLHDARGHRLGRIYLNPHSKILGRLLSRDAAPIDEEFFFTQLRHAQLLREQMLGVSASSCGRPYRVVYGESDALPGLIVDRYGDALVLQLLTAGMDRRRDMIVSALDKLFQPRLIVGRNDSPIREREGLPRDRSVIKGQLTTEAQVSVNGLRVTVDLGEGQKTGLYLDQVQNYEAIKQLSSAAMVLDCFCYLGLWGLHAAHYGAAQVIGVDQSAIALERAATIVKDNGYADRCTFHVANVFDDLRERDRRREVFDLIILDPPAFVKSRARLLEAVRGYKEINLRAMKLLKPGGFLVTCSCSHHLSVEHFGLLLQEAAADVGRAVRLLERRGQGADHPILLAMPETEYLKCFLVQVL